MASSNDPGTQHRLGTADGSVASGGVPGSVGGAALASSGRPASSASTNADSEDGSWDEIVALKARRRTDVEIEFLRTPSRAPIAVPEPVRPVIEAWRRICPDSSPEALMFPTFGRGKRKGQAVPRHAKNFLTWRVRPIAEKLGIPKHLITFQVMRRSLGTHLSVHGTLKDTQGALRHASITTTGNVVGAGRRRERDAGGQLARNNRS